MPLLDSALSKAQNTVGIQQIFMKERSSSVSWISPTALAGSKVVNTIAAAVSHLLGS